MKKLWVILLSIAVTSCLSGVATSPQPDASVAEPQKKLGAANLPAFAGQTDMAHSMPVVIASDQTLSVSATLDTSALATSAKQDTQTTALNAHTTALNMLTQPRTTTTITKSDATDTTGLCNKGVWVGTAGDIAVKGLGDASASTLKNVPSGSFIPGNFLRIMSTNTTATDIVCFGGTG